VEKGVKYWGDKGPKNGGFREKKKCKPEMGFIRGRGENIFTRNKEFCATPRK